MKFIDPRTDPWFGVDAEDGPPVTLSPAAGQLLTLAQWHAARTPWPAGMAVGLRVPNDTDIETLQADLPRLALVALHFPEWTDGRAYSQARLLKSRLRFAGEVRATGDVLVDMLPLLVRTGFDAVCLRADQKLESAQRALRFFPSHYQGDTQQSRPHFARHHKAVHA